MNVIQHIQRSIGLFLIKTFLSFYFRRLGRQRNWLYV